MLGEPLNIVNNGYAKLVHVGASLAVPELLHSARYCSNRQRSQLIHSCTDYGPLGRCSRTAAPPQGRCQPFGHAESTERLEMVGFCDDDWGGEKDDSYKSTTGFLSF
eukprot:363016-Chlamydomonas_euryale.AAC.4